ncbi:MAG: polysaccharide biosynthesis tyrosine autokinase [bacterium]|nr:polysaccharide biosynthesis tyrosine autokinase [bacterium]
MDDLEQERTIHLTEYYHVLLKHKWLILAALIIIGTLTAVYTFRMVPVYRATCTMIIERDKSSSPLTGQRLDYEGWYDQSLRFGTHLQLINSRPVLLRVIKKLKLDQPKKEKDFTVSPAIAFFSDLKKKIRAYIAGLKNNIRILLGRSKPEPTPREKQDRLIQSVKSSISIEAVEETNLLNINAVDYDPDLAADIANSVALSYIEFNLNNRTSSSRNTLNWMSNQLYEIQKKLEDAEEDFLAYKQNEKLYSLEARQAGFTGKIEDLNDIYIQTRNQRVEAITKLKELERGNKSWVDARHVRALLNNPMINDLYSRLLNLEIELTRLSKVYKHKHPKTIQAKTALESTRANLRAEIKKEMNNIKAELAMSTQKEEALKQNIENLEADALTTNRKELRYTILERNVTTQQQLYDVLLQRVNEADITGDIDVSNIRITETAVPPPAPFKPNKPRQMMLGIIFGLMVGAGLAFLREYLDRTLRTEEDIQRHLALPVLGIIPEAEAGDYKKQNIAGVAEPAAEVLNGKHRARSVRARSLRRVFLDGHPPNSGYAETYRTLRTNIHFCRMDKRVKSIVLTSAVRAEGKTVTTANMAFAAAQAGMSVLMIDADLRKPTLSSLIRSSRSPGLTGLLTDVFGTEIRGGSLGDYQLGDLFRLLGMQKKTGLLHLTEASEAVELIFYQGKLVDLNWLTRPKEERLASVLVAGRVITKEQVQQALAQQKATGQKLGFILLNNGYIKREALTGPLALHMMEGLRKALSFSEGSFAFKERSESDFEPDTFDPVDFDQIYKQLIIGEEPIAYLREMINQAVLKTHVKNLFLLPAGSVPPNPSELLSSNRMPFLLSNLQKRFDLMVIDTPPVVPASDALLIAPHVDGVLLVVRAGEANREMVIKTVQSLRTLQPDILGVALNQVDIKRPGYYKYYFKNYANYYAERV